MDGYSSKVYFHLPYDLQKSALYKEFFRLWNSNRSMFLDNAEIGSLYGCFPSIPWNGGRAMWGEKPPESFLREKEKEFRSLSVNVPLRFTFTNTLLTEDLCKDPYSNLVLKIFSTGNNEVIVNSPILESYIRDNYGDKYKYISSTTKCIKDIDKVNEEIEKYYLTVLDYNFNNDIESLKKINHPEKCEILCNSICYPGCSRRSLHYDIISKAQIFCCQIDESFYCKKDREESLYFQAIKNPLYVSKEKINKVFIPLGYKNFKLEGRTNPCFDVIEFLTDYLVKDRNKLFIRERLLRESYSF